MLVLVLGMLLVTLEQQQQTLCQVPTQLVGVRARREAAAACRLPHQGQLQPAAPKVLLLAAQHGSQVGSRTPRLHPAVQQQQQ